MPRPKLTDVMTIDDKCKLFNGLFQTKEDIRNNFKNDIDWRSIDNHKMMIMKYKWPDCDPLLSILNDKEDNEYYSFINYDKSDKKREPLHVEINGIHYYVVGLYKREYRKKGSERLRSTLQKYYIVSSDKKPDRKCFCWNGKTINNEILPYIIEDVIENIPEKREHRELVEKYNWKDCPPLAKIFGEEINQYYKFCNYDKREPLHVEIDGVHYYVVHDTRDGAYDKGYVVDSEGEKYGPYPLDFIKENIKDFEYIKNSKETRENIEVGDTVTFISFDGGVYTVTVTKINGDSIEGLSKQNSSSQFNKEDIIKVIKKKKTLKK